ncbi:GNAT family N-acetyltransferase [Williamsia sp. CHRR-6]|uniref:GNAT family N-acetyltransferase n=1 Tax=Williamsia sp. CHRR-6 TaxID=2835871 RepID=UPI001BDAF2DC|nr:GNAT family N-acetyltransferase [Williamsia sp. CHRR-6]MBT0566653.1 GNAT family N-acetyltransferase [Williamsia sp. CHRR-6]
MGPPPPGPHLRILVPEDDPDLRALLEDSVTELHRRYPDYLPDPLIPDGEYFVAEIDGQAVGCVALRVPPDLPDEGHGEVKRLYVAPYGRRRGVAAALMGALETRARARGMTTVVLETGTAQPEAMALYTALGYQPTPSFGEWATNPQSRCYAKRLDTPAR